jgi:hypothetical protein
LLRNIRDRCEDDERRREHPVRAFF